MHSRDVGKPDGHKYGSYWHFVDWIPLERNSLVSDLPGQELCTWLIWRQLRWGLLLPRDRPTLVLTSALLQGVIYEIRYPIRQDRLWQLPNLLTGQGFLLVFSITSLSSLNELYELREQIIRIKDDERVPLVIVGNKSDLEEDRAVSRARAFAVSQSWGNAPYYETSARRRANVDDVFINLCRQIIRKDLSSAQVREHEVGHRRRDRPNRHTRRRRRERQRCTIL